MALASKLVTYQKTLPGAEIHITPCVTSYGARGGCASKRIPKGDLIARIPKKEVWSHETLSVGDVGTAFADITKELGRKSLSTFCPLVAYHLLHERERGASSKWALQIEHVATSTNDSALTWTKERILEDYGMELYLEAGAYAESILATYRDVRNIMKSRMPSLLKYSFPEYLWAYSKCSSRAWGYSRKSSPFMAPGAADILNSGKRGMVYLEIAVNGDLIYTAGVDFEMGDELQYWYEEVKETDQLLAYGYLPRKV